MAKILDLIYRVKDDASRPIKKIKGEQDALTQSVKGAAIAMGAASAAIFAAKKAYDEVVGSLITYNKEILDASQSTGMAVEDLSRFVQVADDVGIGMDTVTKALEMATKRGFAPSIDSLAQLADEADAIADPTERAAMLSKIFGKNWAELNPVLALGAKRIRELAAAQKSGLTVTEAEIRQSERLRLELDELGDNWTSIKNTIGGELIPVLNQLLTAESMEAAGLAYRAEKIALALEATSAYAKTLREDYVPALQATGVAVGDLADAEGAASVQAWLLLAAKEEMVNGQTALWEYYIQQASKLDTENGKVSALIGKYERLLELREGGFGPAEWAEQSRRPTVGVQGHAAGAGPAEFASGGPVSGGQTVLVGERGPELFTPGRSGQITPNIDQLAREIRNMVNTLPVVLRDAVAKA